MAAHDDRPNSQIQELIEPLLPSIQRYLYNLEPFDTLFWRSLFALPEAVKYIQQRFFLPVTGELVDVYSHYPKYHNTVDLERIFGPQCIDILIADNLVSELDKFEDDDFYQIETSYRKAAKRGHYDVMWYILDRLPEYAALSILYIVYGKAYHGEDYNDDPRIMEAWESIEDEEDDLVPAYALVGAFNGGHVELMDTNAQRLGTAGRTIFNDPVRFLDTYLMDSTKQPSIVKHIFESPLYKTWLTSGAEVIDGRLRFYKSSFGKIIKGHIEYSGSRELVQWALRNSIIVMGIKRPLMVGPGYLQECESRGYDGSRYYSSVISDAMYISGDDQAIQYVISRGNFDVNEQLRKAASQGNLRYFKIFESLGGDDYSRSMSLGYKNRNICNYLKSKGIPEPVNVKHQEDVVYSDHDY